ncbi:RHS repeat-associated core domain-containing protein [Methylocystis sp. JAN1]|uniref:RHS repeat-associated core domain-containing protein n=1 Tax=Methylocystis sp. JAN1 TaxID=3397211 RepID=UPI003FA2D5F7
MSFEYDGEHRLSKAYQTNAPTSIATYGYDALNRLASRTLNGATTFYIHDLANHIIAETDATGATLREYIWLGDLPVAVVAGVNTATPVAYYVHTDHLGRPVRMTSPAGGISWWAVYSPFGTVYATGGALQQDMRFPGQWFQLESGLAYNWNRHYDATLGRYVQPDPIGLEGGRSLYGYVGGNPASYIDPAGEFSFIPIIAGVGAGLAFDYALREWKDAHCSCKGSTTPAGASGNGAAGGANGAFGPFASKPRVGIGGGGPSGLSTSSFSQAVGDAYQADLISIGTRNALRGAGSILSELLPPATLALAAYEIYGAANCQ